MLKFIRSVVATLPVSPVRSAYILQKLKSPINSHTNSAPAIAQTGIFPEERGFRTEAF